MSTKDFAEKFIKAEYEALNKGNVGALEVLYDPRVVYHHFGVPDLVGLQPVMQATVGLRKTFSDYQQECKYLTGEGNLFTLSFKSSGIFTGELPGYPPPTGKEVKVDALRLFRMQNSKIVEVWSNGTITGLS
jgi:predicted ester cyclase